MLDTINQRHVTPHVCAGYPCRPRSNTDTMRVDDDDTPPCQTTTTPRIRLLCHVMAMHYGRERNAPLPLFACPDPLVVVSVLSQLT